MIKIIYMQDKYSDTDSVIASKMMMKSAGVSFREYEPTGKVLELKL